ncbi:MAG TPA: ribose-phosphate pyrophosphokinase [Candidatus Nitrosocosmicus sp.]|nr:ribose-phosphate pyrophosphokinase [Candidatus Nitrosocosmicus sp.]
MKLFTGSSNPNLTQKVADILNVTLSKATVTNFGNSELKVRIEDDVKNEDCVVIQPTSNPTNTSLMELCFFCDALRREEAHKVIGIIPYFGYAKQNIQHVPGECVSVNVVIKFLETLGFSKIYTFDLHDEATAGVFSIPFRNMSALPFLAQKIKKYFESNSVDINDVVVVSPDQGAVEKVRQFGTSFYGTDEFHEVVIEKKRDQKTAHKAHPMDLYGNVEGKIALIVDDMVVSGSTVIPAVDLCLERGATKVYVTAVHHDFTTSAHEKLQNSKLERFFTTDSILLKEEQRFEKLEEFSLAELIAEELRNL